MKDSIIDELRQVLGILWVEDSDVFRKVNVDDSIDASITVLESSMLYESDDITYELPFTGIKLINILDLLDL